MEKKDIISEFYWFLRDNQVFGAYMNGFLRSKGDIAPIYLHHWFMERPPYCWLINAFNWGSTPNPSKGWGRLSDDWEARCLAKFGREKTYND